MVHVLTQLWTMVISGTKYQVHLGFPTDSIIPLDLRAIIRDLQDQLGQREYDHSGVRTNERR